MADPPTASKTSNSSEWISTVVPMLGSFTAGVATASLVYFARSARLRRTADNDKNDNYSQSCGRDNSESRDLNPLNLGLLRRMMEEKLTSRIGELPRPRRTHWPWDRPKTVTPPRILSSKVMPQQGEEDTTTKTSTNSLPKTSQHVAATDDLISAPEIKSTLCIGSIFGLDVGGTLAKLAYFETAALMRDNNTSVTDALPRHRDRLYRSRASAQAVCMARRRRSDGSTHHYERSTTHHYSTSPSFPGIQQRKRRSKSLCTGSRGSELHSISTPIINGYRNDKSPHPLRRQHSSTSDEDLKILNMLRQESVPEDLHAFAEAASTANIFGPNGAIFNRHANESDHDEKGAEISGATAETTGISTNRSSSSIRRTRSMFDLSTSSNNRDHAEALDRFYNFARRLDSYREGVRDHKLSFYSNELGGEFHFIRFETRRMQNAMDLIRANKLHLNIHEMGGTGGGAHKFAAIWKQELGIEMKKQDELDSLVAGMQFVLSTVIGECYTFRPREPGLPCKGAAPKHEPGPINGNNNSHPLYESEEGDVSEMEDDEGPSEEEDRGQGDEWWWSRKVQRDSISYSSNYPYLVVTIGTGVSVLRVDGPRKYERVSGSTIGGGTYLGLIRLLTDVEDFEDVMRLAERGDPSKVDMLVGDIYGENSDALEKLGLPSNLVASSFGKLVAKEDPAAGLKQEDLARALLLMITNNIGQVAHLNAKLFKTPRIYFVGNFLRHNKISQRRLSYAINYWSKGDMEALFLEHEGYFGALGAFLLAQEISISDTAARRYQPSRAYSGILDDEEDENAQTEPLQRNVTT